MNSYDRRWKPAVLIDSTGRQQELKCFSHDKNSEAGDSCSLVWNNQLFVFGGNYNRRQISRLDQYELHLIGELSFDFYLGACTNMADLKLFLCFQYNSSKGCYWSANPLGDFKNASLASYHHSPTRISSSKCKFFMTVQVCRLRVVGKNSSELFQLIFWQSAVTTQAI